jgi:hypothetical protein
MTEELQRWIDEGKRDGRDYLIHGYDYNTKKYFYVYASVADIYSVAGKHDRDGYRLDGMIPLSEAAIARDLAIEAARPGVKDWIAEGRRDGQDYLFLIHDNFSHDDYYEFASVADFDSVKEKYSHQDVDMQWISQIVPLSPAAVEHYKSIEKDLTRP